MESDFHTVKGIPGYLHQANEYFAQLHGLSLEDAAKQLRSNWETFHSIQCPEDSGSEDTDSEEAAY